MKCLRHSLTLREFAPLGVMLLLVAVVFFPLLAQTNERARQHNCLVNGKLLGRALLSYVADYDDQFPRVTYQRPGPDGKYTWRAAILPYLHRQASFACPSDPEPLSWSVVSPPVGGNFRERPGHASFAANAVHAALGDRQPPFGVQGQFPSCEVGSEPRVGDLADLSSLVLLSEIDGLAPALEQPDQIHDFDVEEQVAARHFGQAVFIAADGHGSVRRPSEVPCHRDGCRWAAHVWTAKDLEPDPAMGGMSGMMGAPPGMAGMGGMPGEPGMGSL